MKKALIGIVVMLVSVSALAHTPAINGVIVQQRWPWSRLVDIDYVLDCDLRETMDISVEVYNGDVPLDVPGASFSGDLFGVQCGARQIVWDPTSTAYTNNRAVPEFRVKLTPTLVPLYMIVDLTQSPGEEDQIEYVYESDITNGLWGAWVRNPVTNDGTVIESVIWTGVTTNDIYKTDKLVLRRIPKGTFEMGGAAISTTLTKDFYAGVFQVTQRQVELITDNDTRYGKYFTNPDYYKPRPAADVSYNLIRGATNSISAIDWPETGSLVEPTSFLGHLRAKTGLLDFDLPTDAQWEYACRAGTTTYYNDGNPAANGDVGNRDTNEWHDVLGRYIGNGGALEGSPWPPHDSGPEIGSAYVGSYLPNAWGLYDMHGNVWEWCLDWHDGTMEGGEDPEGPRSGEKRRRRGGSWVDTANHSRTTASYSSVPSERTRNIGFRVFRTLP